MNKKIIWGIVIAVIVIVGGYFTFIHNINGGPDYGKTGPVEKPNIETSESTSTAQSNSDWKTYVNSADHYSVKYPSQWTAQQGIRTPGLLQIFNPTRVGKMDTDIPSEGIAITIVNTGVNCKMTGWEEGFGLIFYRTMCVKDNPKLIIKMQAFDKEAQTIEENIVSSLTITN